MANPPVHVLRYGTVKVCIWQNETSNGLHYSVTIARLFKNGDRWNESSRFGRDDLLVAAKLLDQAHSWICEMIQAE
ncbi:MAG: hypothetical protein NXI32_25180 [bacterium]|nr:hypothetical protein [bacterium]